MLFSFGPKKDGIGGIFVLNLAGGFGWQSANVSFVVTLMCCVSLFDYMTCVFDVTCTLHIEMRALECCFVWGASWKSLRPTVSEALRMISQVRIKKLEEI